MPSLAKSLFATVLISATALSPIAASAETILGALSKAYQNNSSLNSARAGVRVTDEPFAWDLLEGARGVQLADLAMASWEKRAWVDVPELSL